jgi:hypothetical protein
MHSFIGTVATALYSRSIAVQQRDRDLIRTKSLPKQAIHFRHQLLLYLLFHLLPCRAREMVKQVSTIPITTVEIATSWDK